jgi:hypothetical protein
MALNSVNSTKFANNTLVFIRPVLLIYLGFVATNIGIEGFQPADLVPNAFIMGAIILYFVNVFTDYLRKLEIQRELEIAIPLLAEVQPAAETPETVPSTPTGTPIEVKEPIA